MPARSRGVLVRGYGSVTVPVPTGPNSPPTGECHEFVNATCKRAVPTAPAGFWRRAASDKWRLRHPDEATPPRGAAPTAVMSTIPPDGKLIPGLFGDPAERGMTLLLRRLRSHETEHGDGRELRHVLAHEELKDVALVGFWLIAAAARVPEHEHWVVLDGTKQRIERGLGPLRAVLRRDGGEPEVVTSYSEEPAVEIIVDLAQLPPELGVELLPCGVGREKRTPPALAHRAREQIKARRLPRAPAPAGAAAWRSAESQLAGRPRERQAPAAVPSTGNRGNFRGDCVGTNGPFCPVLRVALARSSRPLSVRFPANSLVMCYGTRG